MGRAGSPRRAGGLGSVWIGPERLGRLGRLVRRSSGTRSRGRRSPRPCLVLGSVLARVGVLLRVDRPIRAARRPVPARAAPVGFEWASVGTVVRRRPERRLASPATRPGTRGTTAGKAISGRAASGRPAADRPWPGRTGSGRRLARALTRSARGPWGRALIVSWAVASARSPTVCPPGGVRALLVRFRRRVEAEPGCGGLLTTSRNRRRAARRRPGSPGSAAMPPIPAASGWFTLAKAAVGALHLVERRATHQPEDAVWIGFQRHGRDRAVSRSARPPGPSSNSAIASAAARPCGSRVTGRWYRASSRSAPIERAGLAQRLDRGRPGPPVVPSPSSILTAIPDGPSSWVPLRGPARMAIPRRASIPALLTRRPGAAFISDVSSRSCRPPTISGLASMASRTGS